MGDTTGISWASATWNPWQGCHKVSEECANCYMYREKKRYGQVADVVVRSTQSTFRKPLTWAANPKKYEHVKYVFPCSWSDFFIEEADAWRAEAWDIIKRTPFTYQVCTKRPERIASCLPPDWGDGYPNVWLGSTVGHPRHAPRLNDICRIPASVHFASVEPMLADFDGFDWGGIDWVICGCESGPKSRETKIEWVRALRDQCKGYGAAFFLKQLNIDGKLVTTPELDGKTYTEFPRKEQ